MTFDAIAAGDALFVGGTGDSLPKILWHLLLLTP
jgi:hypothetical protein